MAETEQEKTMRLLRRTPFSELSKIVSRFWVSNDPNQFWLAPKLYPNLYQLDIHPYYAATYPTIGEAFDAHGWKESEVRTEFNLIDERKTK